MLLRIRPIILFALSVAVFAEYCYASQLLKFSITHHLQIDNAYLEIKASFPAHESGETHLIMPTEWAGANNLDKGIYDITVAPNATLVYKDNEAFILSAAGEPTTLHYKIKSQGDHGFKPQIYKDFFHFFGHTAFIVPDISFSEKNTIVLNWDKPSKKNQLFNSFGYNQTQQTLLLSLNQLLHAVYLAGNVHVNSIKDKTGNIYIATYNASPKREKEVNAFAKKVINTQRKAMHEPAIPYYLVALVDTKNHIDIPVFNGTNVNNAFSFIINDFEKYSRETLLSTFIHEHFHYWIGQKISAGNDYQPIMWFTEGFTDFCSLWLACEHNIISFDDYLNIYNKNLKFYYKHPFRNVPYTIVAKDYWEMSALDGYPYAKGHVFAHEFDYHMRNANQKAKSLIDIISAALQEQTSALPLQIHQDNIIAILNHYSDHHAGKEWVKYFEEGNLIAPSPDLFGKKAHLVWEKAQIPDYGFDVGNSYRYKIVKKVDSHSLAYQAGLREGQVIKQIHLPDKKEGALQVVLRTPSQDTVTIKIEPIFKEFLIPQYKK